MMKHPFTHLVLKLTFSDEEWRKFQGREEDYLKQYTWLQESQRKALLKKHGSDINDEIKKEHLNPSGGEIISTTLLAVAPGAATWPTRP